MSHVILIFIGGGEGVGSSLNFRGGGGGVKKSEPPDFRSPEVGTTAMASAIERLYNPSQDCVFIITGLSFSGRARLGGKRIRLW